VGRANFDWYESALCNAVSSIVVPSDALLYLTSHCQKHNTEVDNYSDVSPWSWPWSLRPKSKSLALALAMIPQVLGLGLELKYLVLALALMVVLGLDLGFEAFKCLHQPVCCY